MKPWQIVVGVGVLLLTLAVLWTVNRSGTDAALRRAEAEVLRLKNVIVAEQGSKAEVMALAAKLAVENEDFKKEIARVMSASPGAKPIASGRVTTGVIHAGSAPPVPGSLPPAISDPGPPPPGEGALGGAPCLLSEGDPASIEVDVLLLETKLGNYTLAGTARVVTYPEGEGSPPSTVLRGPFQAQGSHAQAAEPARPARWGAGVTGVATPRAGALLGPVLAFPPLHLFGSLQVEVQGGPLVGLTTPDLGATATALVRF